MRLYLVGIVAVVAACSPKYVPPAPAPAHVALPVSASFGRTWDAVIDVFSQGTIPISNMERASGFIVAEQASVNAALTAQQPDPYADCGSQVVPLGSRRVRTYFLPSSARYNIVVRGDSTSSTVRVNATFAPDPIITQTKPIACTTTGVFEAKLEQRIKARAESSTR